MAGVLAIALYLCLANQGCVEKMFVWREIARERQSDSALCGVGIDLVGFVWIGDDLVYSHGCIVALLSAFCCSDLQ